MKMIFYTYNLIFHISHLMGPKSKAKAKSKKKPEKVVEPPSSEDEDDLEEEGDEESKFLKVLWILL